MRGFISQPKRRLSIAIERALTVRVRQRNGTARRTRAANQNQEIESDARYCADAGCCTDCCAAAVLLSSDRIEL